MSEKVSIDKSALVALLFVFEAFDKTNGFGEKIYSYTDWVKKAAHEALSGKTQ